MEGIISNVTSTGIGVACILYFMLRDYKFMDTMTSTMQSLNEGVDLIKKYFIKQKSEEDK